MISLFTFQMSRIAMLRFDDDIPGEYDEFSIKTLKKMAKKYAGQCQLEVKVFKNIPPKVIESIMGFVAHALYWFEFRDKILYAIEPIKPRSQNRRAESTKSSQLQSATLDRQSGDPSAPQVLE